MFLIAKQRHSRAKPLMRIDKSYFRKGAKGAKQACSKHPNEKVAHSPLGTKCSTPDRSCEVGPSSSHPGCSATVQSSLNSFSVSARSLARSRIPRRANFMILDATNRVAGSSLVRRPISAHTSSRASDILRIASGSKTAPFTNWRIGMSAPGTTAAANLNALVK
jgi:hypothetical protein